MPELIHIIGGGLAGCEAAYQVARAGLRAVLYEMRPLRQTPAHKTDRLAELVCSNSLKTEQPNSAPWLLKQELRRLDSLLLRLADESRVPGGHALTVDRDVFAEKVTAAVAALPGIEVRREELTRVPRDGISIIATGPLTSDALAEDIARLTGAERLYFYDAISPIVEAGSIDYSVAFRASRYGKSLDGGADYLNCPFDQDHYERFVDALAGAASVPAHIPEDNTPYFEACLPIEELARRGRDTLRFGPLKPAGLLDPRTGRRPWAVAQLRQENLRAASYNLVGFQNHLRFGEQARVLRLIPGLENAEFLRFGQIHRNTYINAPALLDGCLRLKDAPADRRPRACATGLEPGAGERRPWACATMEAWATGLVVNERLQLKQNPVILFAGQISGVEGYVEAIATGLAAGRHAAALARGAEPRPLPRETALGSLCHYISGAETDGYQPANITFDLLPPLDEETGRRLRRDRAARHAEICRRALEALARYMADDDGT